MAALFKKLFGKNKEEKKPRGERLVRRRCTVAAPERTYMPTPEELGLTDKPAYKRSKSASLAPAVSQSDGDSGSSAPPSAPNSEKMSRSGSKKSGKLQREGSVGSRRKKKKGSIKGKKVDVTQPLEWPTTPDLILEYHKHHSLLTHNEEWLIVELNEFECLVENMEIIKKIAKHSKFFEIDPDELWEEFFEYVEEMPSYDEIINYDVWQEFRDKKYPC